MGLGVWGKYKWDLVRCHHGGTNEPTNNQTRKDRATQPMDYGRLRWAMKLTWPQLEVQIWRREGAVVKMSLRCQSDVQIYCGESLGQKIFMFFRSDRPLFCWSSSFKYLPALIVVRMNTNIFNQTISLLLKYQTIISGGPIPYFLFQLISAFISLAAQQVFHKKPAQVSTLEEFDRRKVDFTIIISITIIIRAGT